jgi:hypothetical protein
MLGRVWRIAELAVMSYFGWYLANGIINDFLFGWG